MKAYPGELYVIKTENMYALLKALFVYDKTINSYAFGEYAHVSFHDDVNENSITDFLRAKGFNEIEVKKAEPTIEDCFIQLLKR